MLAGGLNSRTHVFWTVVRFSTFNLHIFLQHLHVFLTTFMVVITYTTILTYKHPSILPHFLTPNHFLSLLTLSLYFSSFFFSFNSLLGAKVIRLLRDKIVSSRLGVVINPCDKIKFASFYPKNFLPWDYLTKIDLVQSDVI